MTKDFYIGNLDKNQDSQKTKDSINYKFDNIDCIEQKSYLSDQKIFKNIKSIIEYYKNKINYEIIINYDSVVENNVDFVERSIILGAEFTELSSNDSAGAA
jgi:hypothetical protein